MLDMDDMVAWLQCLQKRLAIDLALLPLAPGDDRRAWLETEDLGVREHGEPQIRTDPPFG